MWTTIFWKDLAERAVATFAQSLGALVAVDVAAGIQGLDIANMVSVAAVATLASVLKSFAANELVGDEVSPASLAK